MKGLLLIALVSVSLTAAHAQPNAGRKKNRTSYITKDRMQKKESTFLEKQWWLGLKGGTNLSRAVVTTHFSGVAPTNYPMDLAVKEYEDFKSFGSQVTLEGTFYFRQLSLSLQPTYSRSQFVYTNHYAWWDPENAGHALELHYRQAQKTEHLLIPVLVRYDLTATRLRPFIQAGAFAALLINAGKEVTISGTDYASGGEHEFTGDPIIVGASDLFAPSYYGLIGGAGVHYHQGNVRLSLDVSYRYGMTNIVSPSNRYGNDRLAGVGDAMDDMTLDNIVVSLGCVFPLRFLGNAYKAVDNK
ncbi:MAG: PorT family protein [Cyclobacteriaceae bacterium]|nr:PorT family protein [Cyclobacteriaceae bacterium]